MAKKNRILDLYDHPPTDGRVICVDEFGPLNLQTRPGHGWFPIDRPARLRATYTRRAAANRVRRGGDVFQRLPATRRRHRRAGIPLRPLGRHDAVDRPGRGAGVAAAGLRRDLPALPRATPARPRDPSARHPDRDHQTIAAGGFIDVHQPLGGPITLEYGGTPIPKKANKVGAAGRPVAGSLLRPDPPD